MARREFLEYVWNKMVRPQVGYSFSIPHDIAYSIEAVQEANLATRYNPLFWACACLCVNAGSSATDFEDNSDEDYGDEEDSSPLWETEADDDTLDVDEIKKLNPHPLTIPRLPRLLVMRNKVVCKLCYPTLI